MSENMNPEGLELVKLVNSKVDALGERFERFQDGMGERFDKLSETLSAFAKTNSDDHESLSERVRRLEDPPISLIRRRIEFAKTTCVWGLIFVIAAKELLPDKIGSFLKHFLFQS